MWQVRRFKTKDHDAGPKGEEIFITISRVEAMDLIKSLAGQLAKNDPNSGRVEPQWTDKDRETGPAKGHITIAVQDPFRCLACRDEVEAWTGVKYRGSEGYLCPRCAKKVCGYCQGLVHSSSCPRSTRRIGLEE